jgi:putative transposase
MAKFSKLTARLQGELDLRRRTWGGAREGAGRKKKTGKRPPAHRERAELRAYHPVHVVMRVKKGVPRLRKARAYLAIRRSLVRCLGNEAFRVCHVSIQANHLHFIVEAKDKLALSAGMQRLNILIARRLNRELGRRGRLFEFRYHATQIKSPKQARHALAYVLNNWRRHREDESCGRAKLAKLDPYSTAIAFNGWTFDGITEARFDTPADYTPLPVSDPATWLLRVGWRKHGPINVHETPGPLQS